MRGGLGIDEQTKGLGHLSVGYSNNNIFGIGAGIGYISFEKPYIPLTVDLSFFGKSDKVSPVIIGSAGYGVYQYNTAYTKVRGGFTGSINAGVSFPLPKSKKAFVTGGYAIYSFTGDKNIAIVGEDASASNSAKMLVFTAGFKF